MGLELPARETWQGWGERRVGPAAFESSSTALLSSSAPQSTIQSYLEGVGAGLEQLRSAAQEVQSVCQELGAARWALLDSVDCFQGLQQMRALMAEHVQLASVVRVLPQLFSGKAPAWSSRVWAGRHWGELQPSPGWVRKVSGDGDGTVSPSLIRHGVLRSQTLPLAVSLRLRPWW